MPEKALDIILAARDEASGTFNKVAHEVDTLSKHTQESGEHATSAFGKFTRGLREMDLEGRQTGERSLERMLRGAGVVGLADFALEGLSKAAEATREALRGLADGSMNVGQAVGSVVEKTAAGIPVLSHAVTAFRGIEDAGWDSAAALAKLNGANEQTVNWLKSSASIREEAERAIKAETEAVKSLTDALRAEREAGTVGTEAKEKLAAEQEFQKKITEIREREKKARDELGGTEGDNPELRTTMAAFRQAELAARRAYQEKLTEADRNARREREQAERDHQSRMRDASQAALSEQLRAAGMALDAEQAAMATRHEKAIDDILKRRDAALKARPQDRGQIMRDASEEMRAANEAQSQLTASFAQRREQQERDRERQLNQIRTTAAAEHLRNMGQDAAARLLELKAEHARELTEIEQAEKTKVDALSRIGGQAAADAIEKIRKQATEELNARRALHAEQEQAAQREAERDRGRQQDDVRTQLAQMRIGLLREEAATGDKLAEQEAKRLELVERFREQRERLTRLLQDEKGLLTAADKAQTESMLSALDAQQKLAEANLTNGTGQPGGTDDLRGTLMEANPMFTGVRTIADYATASEPNERQQMVTEQTKSNNFLADIAKGVGVMASRDPLRDAAPTPIAPAPDHAEQGHAEQILAALARITDLLSAEGDDRRKALDDLDTIVANTDPNTNGLDAYGLIAG